MTSEIFIDTSGFYALLVKRDAQHPDAVRRLREARRRKRKFVTSDYVVDETATLLKARGHAHILGDFFDSLRSSHACRTEWTDSERFYAAQAYFLKHKNQAWSFTDCLSFCIMKELRLRDALTKDGHFNIAGFVALLR
jgi:uncharacterized protein